jgi:DNA-binding MarR family transcriptional regulator
MSITDAGERLAQSVESNTQPLQRELWRGITDLELEQLNVLLKKCLENLGSQEQLLPER